MSHETVAELRDALAASKKAFAAVAKVADGRVTRFVESAGGFFSLRPLLPERSGVERHARSGVTTERSRPGTVLGLDENDRVWTITTRDASGTVTERTVLSREGASTRLIRKQGARFIVEASEGEEDRPLRWWWCSSFGGGSGLAERSGTSLRLSEVTHDFESKQSFQYTDLVELDATEQPVAIVRTKPGAPDRALWRRPPVPAVRADESALLRWLDGELAAHAEAGALLLLEGQRNALAYFVPRDRLEHARTSGHGPSFWLNPAEHDTEELDVPLPPGLSAELRHAALIALAKHALDRAGKKGGARLITSVSDPEMATLEPSLREIYGRDAEQILGVKTPPSAAARSLRKRRVD